MEKNKDWDDLIRLLNTSSGEKAVLSKEIFEGLEPEEKKSFITYLVASASNTGRYEIVCEQIVVPTELGEAVRKVDFKKAMDSKERMRLFKESQRMRHENAALAFEFLFPVLGKVALKKHFENLLVGLVTNSISGQNIEEILKMIEGKVKIDFVAGFERFSEKESSNSGMYSFFRIPKKIEYIKKTFKLGKKIDLLQIWLEGCKTENKIERGAYLLKRCDDDGDFKTLNLPATLLKEIILEKSLSFLRNFLTRSRFNMFLKFLNIYSDKKFYELAKDDLYNFGQIIRELNRLPLDTISLILKKYLRGEKQCKKQK